MENNEQKLPPATFSLRCSICRATTINIHPDYEQLFDNNYFVSDVFNDLAVEQGWQFEGTNPICPSCYDELEQERIAEQQYQEELKRQNELEIQSLNEESCHVIRKGYRG